MALAPIGGVVSAAAPTYGGIIVGRVLNGIGSSAPLGIGAATVMMFAQIFGKQILLMTK